MSGATQLTYPFRVIRARIRTMQGRRRHRAELRRGDSIEARPDRTPIFVLGSPRSGTTLLFQLLVDGLDVGWLSNAHDRDPNDVAGIERREQPRVARTSSDWESEHGTTSQPWGPSEAPGFWYRFVPRTPHELTAADATPARTRAIRSAVREFADACGAPVVFKNVFNSLRVPVLDAALPEARYIVIHRDVETNARSLYAGRIKRGDTSAWWSAQPAGLSELGDASPGTQVVWQTMQMNAVADRELARLEASKSMHVSYDELCAAPRDVLARIHAWLNDGGSDVALRADANIPASFPRRAGGTLAPEYEADLRAALDAAGIRPADVTV